MKDREAGRLMELAIERLREALNPRSIAQAKQLLRTANRHVARAIRLVDEAYPDKGGGR